MSNAIAHQHFHVFLSKGHESRERKTSAVISLCGAMMIAEISAACCSVLLHSSQMVCTARMQVRCCLQHLRIVMRASTLTTHPLASAPARELLTYKLTAVDLVFPRNLGCRRSRSHALHRNLALPPSTHVGARRA